MENDNSIRIALGQILVEGGEPDRNLERAEKAIEDGANAGAQIVLLPECLDLGWTHPSALNEAEPIPGPRAERLIDKARQRGVYLCAGLTEKFENRVFNSAIFSAPDGSLLHVYRKINVLDIAQQYYSIGRSLSVIETPLGNIGINICADNYADSLELGHTLGRMGAQIILSPSSWTVDFSITDDNQDYLEKWVKPYHTLAELYDMVIVSVTSVGVIVGGPFEGKKMVGCSVAVGSEGIIFRDKYNEFAGSLGIVDIEVPAEHPKGTDVGKMLREKGYVNSYR